MAQHTSQFEHAVSQIREALSGPVTAEWGWQLRSHLRSLRVAMVTEPSVSEGWLAARCAQAQRERHALIARIAQLSPIVLAGDAVEDVRETVEKLLHDVERHRQRVHDLIYDAVSLELGGSE